MKAVITTEEPRRVFACPDCGSPEHSFGHLLDGTMKVSFGPWYCDQCGCAVRGKFLEDGTIDIERHTDRKAHTLVLLRLDVPGTEAKPVHIVVKGMVFYPDGEQPSLDNDNSSYFYNEHTCPWNYLRLPIKEGDDTDPHGLFVHQETILMPKGYINDIDDVIDNIFGIEAWQELFPSLRKPAS